MKAIQDTEQQVRMQTRRDIWFGFGVFVLGMVVGALAAVGYML